jgi:hypothetical protein
LSNNKFPPHPQLSLLARLAVSSVVVVCCIVSTDILSMPSHASGSRDYQCWRSRLDSICVGVY